MSETIRVAIAGVGNCASSLIQGLEFYKNNPAQMNSLKSPIFENKVIKLISEKASVKEQKVSSEELNSKIATIEKEMGSNIS